LIQIAATSLFESGLSVVLVIKRGQNET